MNKTKAIVIIASNSAWVENNTKEEWNAWKEACNNNKKRENCCQEKNDEYLRIDFDNFSVIVFNKEKLDINNEILNTVAQKISDIEVKEIYIHEYHETFEDLNLPDEIIKGVYTSTERGNDKDKLDKIEQLILLLGSICNGFCNEIEQLKTVFSTAQKKTDLAKLLKKLYLIVLSLVIDVRGVAFCKKNNPDNIGKYIEKIKEDERNNRISDKIESIRNALNGYTGNNKNLIEEFINIGKLKNEIKASNTNNFIEKITQFFRDNYDKTIEEYCQDLLNLSMKIKNAN